MEVRNRFKGLDLTDRVPDELLNEVHDTVQKAVIKTIPKKRNAQRQSGCLTRPYKQLSKEGKLKAKEKRKDIPPLNAEIQRLARRIRKASSGFNAKK